MSVFETRLKKAELLVISERKMKNEICFSSKCLYAAPFLMYEYAKLQHPSIMGMWKSIVSVICPDAYIYIILDCISPVTKLWWLKGLLAVWETLWKSILQLWFNALFDTKDSITEDLSPRGGKKEKAAKIANPPTDWSYDFTETCYYSYAMCSCFLSPCSGLCTSDISTAAVLYWLLFILRPQF